ncbi:MAG: hypothetical protein WDN25_19815 [Acetobacteraceae bacterium]
MLTTYLAFDTSVLQTATRPVGVLQQRMLYLLPVLSGIANRSPRCGARTASRARSRPCWTASPPGSPPVRRPRPRPAGGCGRI